MSTTNGAEEYCPRPSEEQLHSLREQDKHRKIVDVPVDVLAQIRTNRNQDLESLSRTHKVMLLFLRHSRCCFCKEAIYDIADNLSVLIQLNTVPVLVHMENTELFDEFIATFKNEKISSMIRIHDANGKIAEHFEVGDVRPKLKNVIPSIMRVRELKKRGIENNVTPPPGISKLRLPALFIIENAKVVHEFRHISISTRPDYLAVLIDPAKEGSASEASAPNQAEIRKVYSTLNKEEIKKQASEVFVPPAPLIPETAKSPRSFGCLPSRSSDSIDPAMQNSEHHHEDARAEVISTFLTDPVCRRYFKLQASKEHSCEHILFWEDIQLKYKAMSITSDTDMENKRKLAENIIENYFNEDSILAINTNSELKMKVKERLAFEGPQFDLFDEIVADLEVSTLRDTYMRFLTSAYYKQMKFSYKRATIM